MILTNTVPNGKTFNNVFDELFRTLNSNAGSTTVHTATPVNIVEADNKYTVSFNAPGRLKEKFKLSVENGLLTVSYEMEPTTEKEHQKVVRNEFTITNFKRSFSLNDKVNEEGIEAKYENGILKVVLPKKEIVKITPKQISIQ